MADFGLGRDGFKRKRYEDSITSMEGRARSLFGSNVNLSERSPLGIIFQVTAFFIAQVWTVAERVYNSAFVDTAEGETLDYVGAYIGIRRLDALPATGEVEFTGDDGTDISEGFQVATEEGVKFATTEAGTISGGSVTLPVEAVEPGADGNLQADTVTEVVNPLAGIDSVTNPEEMTGGREQETDPEFRERYRDSVAGTKASTLEAIRARLLKVTGVRTAIVLENNTMETVDGRPPKSFEPVCLGGEPEEIAEAIFETRAAGIATHGDEEAIAEDVAGREHTIKFSYADEIDLHVSMTLTTDERFPEEGEDLIVSALVQLIGGEDKDGEIYAGLGMNEDVSYTKVVSAVYSAPGIVDADVDISDDGESFNKQNIETDETEVAELHYDNVVIEYAD